MIDEVLRLILRIKIAVAKKRAQTLTTRQELLDYYILETEELSQYSDTCNFSKSEMLCAL